MGKFKEDPFALDRLTHRSQTIGKRKPVVWINRVDIEKYCNLLSEKHGFEPVYVVEIEEKSFLDKKKKLI